MSLKFNAIAPILAGLLALSCGRSAQPASDPMFGAPLSAEADAYLTACNTEFNAKQEELHSKYLKDTGSYDADLEKGTIQFQRAGKPVLVFDVQVIGSVSKSDKNWEWAWNNPNVPANLSRDSANVKIIGERLGLPYLTSGFAPVPDDMFPRYLSGIALKVSMAIGVYEAADGDLTLFMLLSNPRDGA